MLEHLKGMVAAGLLLEGRCSSLIGRLSCLISLQVHMAERLGHHLWQVQYKRQPMWHPARSCTPQQFIT